jgi:hypothetical protein
MRIDDDEIVALVRDAGPAGARPPAIDPERLAVPGLRVVRIELAGVDLPDERGAPTTFAPPCTPAAVAAAEAALRVVLPPLLARLYTEVADGGFGPGDGVVPVGELAGMWESYAVELIESEDLSPWPAGLVPFCELDQTLTACIDSTTPQGAIVGFEFDDLDPDDPQGLSAALHPRAPSLGEWLRAELAG